MTRPPPLTLVVFRIHESKQNHFSPRLKVPKDRTLVSSPAEPSFPLRYLHTTKDIRGLCAHFLTRIALDAMATCDFFFFNLCYL